MENIKNIIKDENVMDLFFGFLDQECADALGVEVEEYIKKIEEMDEEIAQNVIEGLFSDEEAQINEAVKLYHSYGKK
jgi:hypothetical protein